MGPSRATGTRSSPRLPCGQPPKRFGHSDSESDEYVTDDEEGEEYDSIGTNSVKSDMVESIDKINEGGIELCSGSEKESQGMNDNISVQIENSYESGNFETEETADAIALKTENEELKKKNSSLVARVAVLETEKDSLEEEVKFLKELLDQSKNVGAAC